MKATFKNNIFSIGSYNINVEPQKTINGGLRHIAKADSSEIKRLYDNKIKTMQKTDDGNALFKIGVHGSVFNDDGVGMDLMYVFVEIFDKKSGITYKESHPIYGDKSLLFDLDNNGAIFNKEKAVNWLVNKLN